MSGRMLLYYKSKGEAIACLLQRVADIEDRLDGRVVNNGGLKFKDGVHKPSFESLCGYCGASLTCEFVHGMENTLIVSPCPVCRKEAAS